jgi:hypothetical protein
VVGDVIRPCFAANPAISEEEEEEMSDRAFVQPFVSLFKDTCVIDGPSEPFFGDCLVVTRVRVVLCDDDWWFVGPSTCYSIPYCFFAFSKFSRRASKSSFDRTILSGWWYRTINIRCQNKPKITTRGLSYQRGNDSGS